MKKWKKNLKCTVEEKLSFQDESRLLKEKAGIEPKNPGKARPYVNYGKTAAKVVGISLAATAALVVLVPLAGFLIAGFKTKNNYHPVQRNYSLHEQQQIREDTFRRMNSFEYPSGSELRPVSKDYQNAVSDFSYEAYLGLNKEDNTFFSPLSAYLHLDILSHGVKNSSLSSKMDEVLHLNSSSRESNFLPAFLSNRDPGKEGSSHVEMNQLFFLDHKETFQDSYLDYLTSVYCEAYSLDLEKAKDINLMVDIVNSKVNQNVLSSQDLLVDEYTRAFLFNTVDFFGSWGFDGSKTQKQNFYPSSGEAYVVPFMHHSFLGSAYDYGDYFSFRLSYGGGYSMQFITPKERGGDIASIARKGNFLVENESKKYVATIRGEVTTQFISDVALPRFQADCSLSFKDLFSSMGLGTLYSRDLSPLTGISNGDPLYIQETKQKNHIFWDESGTTAKTITWSGIGAGAAAPTITGLAFDLDSPFLYVIRDRNDLPLYMGRVDRP